VARRNPARWAVLLAVLLVPGLVADSARTAAGPLHTLTLYGQPTVIGGSLEVHPGDSADFTAFVVNPLPEPVTLVSASVVPVAGIGPTGKLVHVGVARTNGMVAAAHGWPVPDFPMEPLAGARIGHGQSNIVFGMVGLVSGVNYTADGLRIRYLYQGRVYSVIAVVRGGGLRHEGHHTAASLPGHHRPDPGKGREDGRVIVSRPPCDLAAA
jgi:hypothetical protein